MVGTAWRNGPGSSFYENSAAGPDRNLLLPLAADGDTGPACRKAAQLSASHWFHTSEVRSFARRSAAADICRSVWLAGNGRISGRGLSQLAARSARENGDLWQQLRPGRRNRLFRPEIRVTEGYQSPPELFSLGPA